ncbi:hypothetical protein P168DRAFT_276958 [Aspergillus campestris IBT 28561]|uniref:F-box domain protein n=1 Tax=Aspergillus campestris (strain IBT 28561) TaxID=1392248 RepID=A0A2I1CQE5_ASPC2|nr:uncharacterized protein P168DRAFT_276958 [Aspergillus campestris IBT 28561]PKX99854.1 hypothetical protein P168DRAFT_276958 [Aspergillus campestris IBT 28561]
MTRVHTLEFAVELFPAWDGATVAGPDDRPTQLTWDLIRSAGQHMRELAVFQIKGSLARMNLRDIVKQVPFTSLKKLQVVRAGEIESGPACVEPKDYQTASFKALDISETRASPDAIAQLIQWPKELVCFSLHRSPIDGADLPMLHSWLSGHRDTLRTIEIGSFFAEGASAETLFNAADFPNLETLLLSRWVMGSVNGHQTRKFLRWSPDHADLLLGPKLHTFTWSFEEEILYGLKWSGFNDQEESWLRGLMKEAVARKSALRKIRVEFSPRMASAEPMEYPWDRMDCLREQFEPYGLTLEYNDPPLTKSEWQAMFDGSFDAFDTPSDDSWIDEWNIMIH